MATEKQCKMLAARSKAAGVDYVIEDFEALTNGQVDEALVKIASATAIKDAQTTTAAPVPERPPNGPRIGLAAKMVIQDTNLGWALAHQEDFAKKVHEVYNILAQAEARIGASAPSGVDRMDGPSRDRYDELQKRRAELVDAMEGIDHELTNVAAGRPG